jgi:putative ABC transport system permease protein
MRIPLAYNLRNLAVRRTSTAAAAVGIALVVTIFILVLAMAAGFTWAVRTAGSAENVIVLRKGSYSEISSGIQTENADSIGARSEIARGPDDAPLLAKEVVLLVILPKADGSPAQVLVRGTQPRALDVRRQARLLQGRMFTPGLPEIVVGKTLASRMKGLALDGTVTFKQQAWKVVGIFDTGSSGFESEIWGDASVLQSAFHRQGVFQSLTFRLARPEVFKALKSELEADPKYEAKVQTEAEYYADQAGTLSTFIHILGTLVTVIMAVGAVFGAMNTMYAAVGSRTREIATLRALGFGRAAILVSFLIESLVLAALGGLLGCLLSLPLNGFTTSTINWDTFSELAFAFRVTPDILAGGMVFALVMGVLGGLFPALRAARMPIVSGLRQG